MRSTVIASIIFTSALAGCSYKSKSRVVSLAQIGDQGATRIFNFMSTSAGEEERRDDNLIDEAVIASLQPGQACFDLTIRSTLGVDVHPSEWIVKVNGASGTVEEIAAKNTETWERSYTSEEVVMRKTSPRGETTISRPVEHTTHDGYTVRRARACAPLSSAPVGKLRLDVELKHPFGDEDWGQIYEWELRG
jgi:hypothetical protein